jgi:hypothetical protein
VKRSGLSSFGPGVAQRDLPVGPRPPRARPEWEPPASALGSSLPAVTVTPVDWPATGIVLAGRSVPAARGSGACQWALDWTRRFS